MIDYNLIMWIGLGLIVGGFCLFLYSEMRLRQLDIEEFKNLCAQANPEIFKILQTFNGSISAEHGVGLVKKEYLNYSKSEPEILIMQGIKTLMDPLNIMNPGKLFNENTAK